MANVTKRSNGYYFIEFNVRGERKTVSIGDANKSARDSVKGWIERLVKAVSLGVPPDAETCSWLSKIEDKFAARLADVGLIEPRKLAEPEIFKPVVTLGPFTKDYIAGRTKLKHWTKTNLNQARTKLTTYFGEERDITTITAGDADNWREWLERSKPSKPSEPQPPGLAENTARRITGRAKQFFKAAVRQKLIGENPFADLVCRVHGSDDERLYFITRAEAEKVLEALPDAQWKLVFALPRFAGLRCPSELSELRVKEIDFIAGKMKVRSPKTEHLKSGAYRIVPIFPELRPYLEAAIAELPKGAEYVVTLPSVVRCRGCEKASNLGTQLARYIKRAGVKVWPKLFQNLRATREIELAEQYGVAVACKWIGNTIAVAQEHYLWAAEHHFVKASGQLIETEKTCTQKSAGHSVGQDVQDGMQQHTPAQRDTLRKTIAKVLKENGLEAKPDVISQLIQINRSAPRWSHTIVKIAGKTRQVKAWRIQRRIHRLDYGCLPRVAAGGFGGRAGSGAGGWRVAEWASSG